MPSLYVGVIGIGFGQQVHVPAFRADGRCQVRALCARTAERARAIADRLGVPEAHGAWQELVASPHLDVVSVAVPPALQPEIVIAAARAGKHVFCEKPAGPDVGRVEAMLEAVRRAGVCHAVDFLFGEIPAWQRAKEVLDSGALGRLRHAHLNWRKEIYAVRHRKVSWKLRQADGGGTLNSFVSHSLYYLEWLFGPAAEARCRLGPGGAESETQVDAWLDFTSGLRLILSVASDAYLGPGHRLEVYGDDGTLVLDNPGHDHAAGFRLLVARRPADALQTVLQPGPFPAGDVRVLPAARLVRRFVDGILHGASVAPNLEHGLRVQRLLDALRRADHTGRGETL
jgi:predicted dehydrogenase